MNLVEGNVYKTTFVYKFTLNMLLANKCVGKIMVDMGKLVANEAKDFLCKPRYI